MAYVMLTCTITRNPATGRAVVSFLSTQVSRRELRNRYFPFRVYLVSNKNSLVSSCSTSNGEMVLILTTSFERDTSSTSERYVTLIKGFYHVPILVSLPFRQTRRQDYTLLWILSLWTSCNFSLFIFSMRFLCYTKKRRW